MFEKRATATLVPIEVLNNPDFSNGKFDFIQNLNLKISIASKEAATNKDGDSPIFDLEAEVKDHPDSLYVKCFAIKANETNDNGDWFSTDELKKSYATFVGKPVFTNHQNNDVEKARGKVVHSWYDDERDGIMIIARVDAVAYPHLARGIKEKYMLSTSMGAQVAYSLCSICHNYASKPHEYCGHIKEQKGRKLSGVFECQYHTRGTEDKCPICSSIKGEKKLNKIADLDAHEKNYGINFIENSFVVNPACHECGVTEVIDISKFLKKVAEINAQLPGLLKSASSHAIACTDKTCISLIGEKEEEIFKTALSHINNMANRLKDIERLEKLSNITISSNLSKFAGEQELTDLRTALDLVSKVSKKMIDQKAQVDLEFLEDLVKAMSQLQETIDELTQMGYGRLQDSSTPTSPAMDSLSGPGAAPTAPSLSPDAANPLAGESKIQSGSAGQVGNVTTPLASLKDGIIKGGKKINISLKVAHGKKRVDIRKNKQR
jgi:hypothetical protein